MTEKEITGIIEENNRRKAVIESPYNPVTGEVSPIERFKLSYFGGGQLWTYSVPIQMYKENKPVLDALIETGSIEDLLKLKGINPTPLAVSGFINELTELRFKYDFEFWAYLAARIQDKSTKRIIPFKLNKPQLKTLVELEKMRVAGEPIRTIILKARQWGGSTLIQIYMAWIQIIHKKNWHSVIVADVEDQARNIRGMYSRFAKEYPDVFGKIELVPFEGSAKNRMIVGRNCIVGVGSAQKPESLRSYDFAMAHLCIHPETLIPIDDGFLKKASELSIGDRIITHSGKLSTIKTITKSKPNLYNGNGEMILIKPWLGSNIILTPNHPVYTKRGWIKAGDIVRSDYVSMPIREIVNASKSLILPTPPGRKQGGGNKGVAAGESILLDKEIGFAFGYYLAEGSIHKAGQQCKEITLTRHDNEVSFADRAINAFKPYIRSHQRKKRPNTFTTHEHINGAPLAKLLDSVLGTKERKRIPDWFFNCGKEFLEGLLQGYLSGDGSKSNGKQGKIVLAAISVTTVSSSLAMQIRDIAASLGLGWGAIDIREAGSYYGRNCKKRYTVRWAGNSARNIKRLLGWDYPQNGQSFSEKTFIENNIIWIKINNIKTSITEYVYDIEVDNPDHSFRTISFSIKNSEVGSWKATLQKSPEDLAQSIRASIPDVPYSLEVVESTAKGVGNFFHREWLAAVNKESSYKPIFIPWFEIPRYQKPLKSHKQFIRENFDNEYVRFLWNLGATLEGIHWYIRFKKGKNYSDWRMNNEFPSTATEAFASSDMRVFNPKYILRARESCIDPEFIGDISAKSQKGKEAFERIEFVSNSKGNFFIWSKPDKSINVSDRYVVSVDIGGRTDNADYSVIKVIDRYWMIYGGGPEVVATWRGHLDQDLIAWKAAQIAKWYNNALLIVESNSLDKDADTEGTHFLTILDEIVAFYSNIYARTDPEKVRQGLPIKYGFQTTLSTKPMVIDILNAALREDGYIERDMRACDEMDTYEIKPNGTMGAVDSCHDDIVMATAIGLWACFKYLPLPKNITYTQGPVSKKIVSEASL